MANRNTSRARHAGYSGMVRMLEGGEKDYGQKTGRCIDSGALRARNGKKAFVPGRPQYKIIDGAVVTA